MTKVARCPHCYITVVAKVGVRSRCPNCSGCFAIEAAYGRGTARSVSAGTPQLASRLEAMARRWAKVQEKIREAAARGEDVTPKIMSDGRLAILGTVIDLGQLSQLTEKARRSETASPWRSRSRRNGRGSSTTSGRFASGHGVGNRPGKELATQVGRPDERLGRGRMSDPPKYPQYPSWEAFDEEHEYQVIVHFPHHLDHEVKATARDGLFIIESLKHDAPRRFYYEFVLPEQVLPSSLRRVSHNGTWVFRFDKKTLEAS